MLSLQQVCLQRGRELLLENVDFQIHAGERWGLIGNNGSGKSSLFELMLGRLQPDKGEFRRPRDWRLAHMAQEAPTGKRSALDYVIDGHQEYRRIEQALHKAQHDQHDQSIAELHAQLEAIDGYSIAARAGQLLHGLGFSTAACSQAIDTFSGGWRIRLNLAQALICPADLLLLDEPTNHLDLDAILWLEKWLRNYPGTLLLISHDRVFLDAVVDRIAHLEQCRLLTYRGNYSSFEQQRIAKLAQQQAQYQQQQERIAEIENFVRRFRAKASKASQAQSRLKALQKLELCAPAQLDSPFSFRFPDAGRMSNPLLCLRQADLGYATNLVLRNVDFSIAAGARIGLLGQNGAGKSTLLKSLSGAIPLRSGERILGEKLKAVYFAQDLVNNLDFNANAIEHLQTLRKDASEQSIRDFLGGFDFRGERAELPVKIFSGGEKTRLALAMCVWQAPNLLILDEPTNHLDIKMREALTLALQTYQGAMLLVSHDRYLLENSVDELWLVADGRVQAFQDDLSAYQRSIGSKQEQQQSETKTVKTDKKQRRQQQAAIRQRLSPLKRELEQAEQQLNDRQNHLSKLQIRLAAPEAYQQDQKNELPELLKQQAQLQTEISALEQDWIMLADELERLQNELTASDE